MGPAVNTFLGIAFLVVGLAATLLMYHLWGYPYDKDKHLSSAPRSLMNLHRLLGYIYVGIYILLMWQMVPRLWTYQIELPARTVVHLTLGLMIGAILVLKIMIVNLFRHLEGTLIPFLGTTLMICTFLVISLSVPFALRESYLRSRALPNSVARAEAFERINRLLEEAGQKDAAFRKELASNQGMDAGRAVLYSSCTDCHDLRTVLAESRSPKNWWSTVKRMAGRSDLLRPITEEQQWQVTAYLIAISPDLQQSALQKKKDEEEKSPNNNQAQSEDLPANQSETGDNEQANNTQQSEAQSNNDQDSGNQKEAEQVFAQPAGYTPEKAKAFYEEACSACHKLEKVENFDFTSLADVERIVDQMIDEEGMELEGDDKATILYYLGKTFVGFEDAKPTDDSPESGEPTEEESENTNSPNEETETDDGNTEPDTGNSEPESIEQPDNYSETIAKFIYENKCAECHDFERIEKYDFENFAGVDALVKKMEEKMVQKGTSSLNDKEKEFLKFYLYEQFVKSK